MHLVLEQLPDVESFQTEKNYVFEYVNGHDNNTLAVDDDDGEEKQAPISLRRGWTKSGRYAYIARKGVAIDRPSIEETLLATDKNK